MKKLILKLFRDIRYSKGQFISIILVISIGAIFSTGLATLSNSLNIYLKDYYKNHNLSDLYVYYSKISQNDISNLEKLDGINKIEGRYTFDATQTFDNLSTGLKIHSIPTNNEINTPTIIKGNLPSNKNEILLDSHYAKENSYAVGDKIKINFNKKEFEFIVNGLCEDVEHAYNIKDPSLVVPNHKLYGIAYILDEAIREVSGYSYYNELMVDSKEGYSIENLGESIESNSKSLTYLYQLSKERTISFARLDSNVKTNALMSKVLSIVFFIVAAIIIFLTMSRIIDSQRSQIGIMKALGIKNHNIILHYIGYSIFVGILGSIIGSVIGFASFIKIGTSQITRNYSLPNFSLSPDLNSLLYTLVLSTLLGVIASYLSCRKVLKECPAQAMRPKPIKKVKKILIERHKGIWNKLSYGNKIILRNIFLTKQRSLFTSIGVIVCVVLLVISFGYKSSIESIGNTLLNDIYKYDMKVDYKNVITNETLKLPTGVENSYTLSELPIVFINSSDKKDAALIVTEKEDNLIKIYDSKSNKISLDDNGVIIPKSYADKYKISEGDSVQLKCILPDFKGENVTMKVSKISLQYSVQSFYCTPAYLKTFDINYNPTSLLVKVNNSSNIDNVYNYFKNDTFVSKVTSKNDLKTSIHTSVKQGYAVIVLFIICAIILSYAAIFTISSINIFERTRELSTLKVLGYQKSRINRLVFTENLMITTFSVIIALPLGIFLYTLFTKELSTLNQVVPNKLNIATLVMSILITFLVTIVSNLFLSRKINKINMIESLKSIE